MKINGQNNRIFEKDKKAFGYADICIVIALLCMIFILLGEPIKNQAIVRIGSRGLLISVYGFAFVQLVTVLKTQGLKNSFHAFILYFVVIIAAVTCGISAVLGKPVQLACFLMLPTCILLFKSTVNVKTIKVAIYVANAVFLLLWTVLFFIPSISHAFYNEFGKQTIEELTLGYDNPNQTGMYLVVSFVIALSGFRRKNNKVIQSLFLVESIWTAYLTILTLSRVCIALIIFISVVWLVGGARKAGKKTTAVILFVPLVFALLLIFGNEKFLNTILFGDTLDNGRSLMVKEFVETLNPLTFIFGNFAKFIGNNMHNGYVTIFAVTGIFGIIVYLGFLWNVLSSYLNQIDNNSPSDKIAFVGILAVILHFTVESAFLTSGMIYALFVGLLFVLTLNEGEEK